MSRQFDGVDDNLQFNAAVVAMPFTVGFWFYTTNDATSQAGFFQGQTAASDNYWCIFVDTTAASNILNMQSRNPTPVNLPTTATFGVNEWHHACGVFESSTARALYLDGGNKVTNVTGSTPTGPVRLQWGYMGDSTPSNPFAGLLAECVLWSVKLNDGEIQALGAGTPPLQIRPASIAHYCMPVWAAHTSPEIDYTRLTNNLTVTGALADKRNPPVGVGFSGGLPVTRSPESVLLTSGGSHRTLVGVGV